MANTWTKNYADGTALFESDLDDLAGTLQPEKANLALATTGSSSGDLLVSAGSNTTPSWSTPNTVAATITSTGANAIFGVISSAQASVSTLIVAQATGTATYGASLANALLGAVSSAQASVSTLVLAQATGTATYGASMANAVIGAVSSVTATTANLIGNAMGASGANAILGAVSSCQASVANLIGQSMGASGANAVVGDLSSCQASVANLIDYARTKNITLDGSDPGQNGVCISTQFSMSTTSTTFTDVTNANCSLTASGKAVLLQGQSRGTTTHYITVANNAGSGNAGATLQLVKGTAETLLGMFYVNGNSGFAAPLTTVSYIDGSGSGGAWKLQVKADASCTVTLSGYLVAYEL